MWDALTAAEICREPHEGQKAVMQRLYAQARKGLVMRADDSEKDGPHMRFLARDLAVFRIFEAARADRGDADVVKALATACYSRQAPDGTHGFGAPVIWAARCLLGLIPGNPVMSAYRIASTSGEGPSYWDAHLVDVTTRVELDSSTALVAQLAIPLGRAFAPILPHFKFPDLEARKAAMQ